MRNLAVLRSNKNWQEVNNQCMTTWRSPVFSSHWVLGNYIIFVNLKSVSHNRTDQAIWAVPKSRFKIGHFKEWPTRFPNFFAWSLMWNLNYLMYFLRNFIDFFFFNILQDKKGPTTMKSWHKSVFWGYMKNSLSRRGILSYLWFFAWFAFKFLHFSYFSIFLFNLSSLA